jgi:hypothetical protein
VPGSVLGATIDPAGQLVIASRIASSCVLTAVTGTGAAAESFGHDGIAPCASRPKVGSSGLSQVTVAAGGSEGDVVLVANSATGLAIARYSS